MNKFTAAASAALLLGVATSALAQAHSEPDFSVRVGSFFPVTDATRNTSTAWFAFGVEYQLAKHAQANDALDAVTISLDYAGNGDFRTVPLLVNIVHYNGPFYVTAGAGVAFTKWPDGTDESDRAELGYQIGIGYDFPTGSIPIFLEAKWEGNGQSDLNGFLVSVGARF